MNPFTESTVARPLPEGAPAQQPGQSEALPQPETESFSPSSKTDGPRGGAAHSAPVALWRLALGRRVRRPAFGARALLVLGFGLAAGLAHGVDVNTATEDQLRAVRGIGPKTAQLIIEERSRGGKYESFDDFSERVKGIGPKKSAALQASGLTVGGASSVAKAAVPGAGPPALSRGAPTAAARTGKPGTK